jgi:DNA (cytosine-5)-methyltransferase 1
MAYGTPGERPLVRIGTVFSGIGAVEHALLRLGLPHEIVFAGDIDKFVKQTYLANFNIPEDRWHDDITEFDATQFRGKVDLLVGGSPCQSFSMVGKRAGLQDDRGDLFFEFVRVLREVRPKAFIFENVRGVLSHDEGRSWASMSSALRESGYSIHFEVLNSRDYGIPQNRSRLFVVGLKGQKNRFSFPAPMHLDSTMQDFLEDFCDSKYYLREKGVKFVTSTKNKLKRYTQINGEIALCQKANQQFNWHGDFVYESPTSLSPDEFVFDVAEVEEKYYLSNKVADYVLAGGTKNFKTSTETDLPVARPLLQSMHKMHRAGVDNYVTHNLGRIRKLTPRECHRLMGFRDSFKIVVSDTQAYRQAGNSIVVDTLIAVLLQLPAGVLNVAKSELIDRNGTVGDFFGQGGEAWFSSTGNLKQIKAA